MPSLLLAPRPAPSIRSTPSMLATPTIPSAPAKVRPQGTRAYRGHSELWGLRDRYIAWMTASGYSPMSIKAAKADLSWFFRWLETQGVDRAADVTPGLLEQYSYSLRQLRNGLAPSVGHIARRLYSLKTFFRWLAKEAVIIYDPAEDLETPKMPRVLPRVILTQQEARKFLDAPDLRSPVGYRDKALLELAYASGLRTAELLRLKVTDIDLKNNIVQVRQGKGRKDRQVLVPPLTMRWVREFIDKVRPAFARRRAVDDGRLWLNYTGGVLDKSQVGFVFKKTRKLAGLAKHVTMMTMRHSIASHLLENGLEIRYIQELLGHEQLSTTQLYSKVTLTGLNKHFRRAHPREQDWAKGKK